MKPTLPRIALVANTAWNLKNFRLGLIRALIARGHKVIAVAPIDDAVQAVVEAGADFVPLHRLSRQGTNPVQDMRLVHELYRIYKRNKIDIALQYTIKPNIYGSFAARFAGIKALCTVTGLGYSFLSTGWVNRIVKQLYKRAFNRAEMVIFQNGDDSHLFEELKLVDKNKIQLVPGSGIRTDYFMPMPKLRTDGHFRFLFVGRLLYDKGIQEFLEAAQFIKKQYPAVECHIVGAIDDENPSAARKELVHDLHKQGIIHYWGKSDDVRSIMRDCDVVVLPSYREGLPRVMLEALSMAKPVITTDAPGCRDTVIDGENGFMIPVKDAQALGNAMQKILSLPAEQLSLMGSKGRAMAVQNFDEQVIIHKYISLIDAVHQI